MTYTTLYSPSSSSSMNRGLIPWCISIATSKVLPFQVNRILRAPKSRIARTFLSHVFPRTRSYESVSTTIAVIGIIIGPNCIGNSKTRPNGLERCPSATIIVCLVGASIRHPSSFMVASLRITPLAPLSTIAGVGLPSM